MRYFKIVNSHAVHETKLGQPIGVWFSVISPTFYLVFPDHYGFYEEDAIEAAAEEAGDDLPLADKYLEMVSKELLEEGMSEEEAWETAYEGAYGLNGGAAWIDSEDWGFWSPTDEEIQHAKNITPLEVD